MAHPAEVVGYTADADTFCVACAEARYPGATDWRADDFDPAEHLDSEGNEVYPLFGSSECLAACCVCGELLDTSWGPDEVDYAVSMLRDAIRANRTSDFLETLADHLGWCWVDQEGERVVRVFEYLNERRLRVA